MTCPILSENRHRYTLFPIQHNNLWDLYKKSVSVFWRPEELDLSKDLIDWNKLSGDEKHFIKCILAFFSSADGIIMENLAGKFLEEVQSAEARSFYSMQLFMENIHSETYSILIDTYITDRTEKKFLFEAVDNFPSIKKKADWAKQYMDTENNTFAERLIAFAVVEGIFFSGAFCSIFWLKKRGLMPGLTFSNELISRDEALHTEFAVELYKMLENKCGYIKKKNIIRDAVEIEKEFICQSLPCRLIGMNQKLMSEYIEFVADRLCSQIGIPKLYNTSNPFDFMELISLEGKTNFFEKRVGEYSLSDVQNSDGAFDFSCTF